METELGFLQSIDKMWISVKHGDCDEFAINEQIQVRFISDIDLPKKIYRQICASYF